MGKRATFTGGEPVRRGAGVSPTLEGPGPGLSKFTILASRRPPTNPTIIAEDGLLSASQNQGIEMDLDLIAIR